MPDPGRRTRNEGTSSVPEFKASPAQEIFMELRRRRSQSPSSPGGSAPPESPRGRWSGREPLLMVPSKVEEAPMAKACTMAIEDINDMVLIYLVGQMGARGALLIQPAPIRRTPESSSPLMQAPSPSRGLGPSQGERAKRQESSLPLLGPNASDFEGFNPNSALEPVDSTHPQVAHQLLWRMGLPVNSRLWVCNLSN